MEYGIPTLMDCPEPGALTRYCAENGFSFVEINMTFPWFQPGVLTAESLRALSKAYGVGFTIHLHDQVNPFEFSPELREGSLRNIDYALGLARDLALPRINMHLLPGTYSSINGRKAYLYSQYTEQYLDLVRLFRDDVTEKLRGHPAVFCIENTSGYQDFHVKALELLLESPAFGLTFDIGHSFRAGGGDEGVILSHRDRLCHFHIHDCDVRANHLALGEGRLDVRRYLDMAHALDATVVTEVKEASALLRTRQYLTEHGLW